jgi:CubicO group peptidase (beta-lactamase class C family)
VLGRVIEVVSGKSFDVFLQTRLFEPLGMVDTSFVVPPDKLSRLVDPAPVGRYPLWDITQPTKLFAGGAGLASTAPGLSALLPDAAERRRVRRQALLVGGKRPPHGDRFAGARYAFKGEVGRWVGPAWARAGAWASSAGQSRSTACPGAVGSYGWSGLWGTYFWIDPAQTARAC